jgi:ECF transporter S component (folate family)
MSKMGFILRRTCLTGMMVAIAILLCRYLGYPATGAWRIEISFLPIYVVALLYGPLWAGAAWGAADLIGAAVTTGVNPFITIIKALCGIVLGLFFHNRRVKLGRILLCTTLIAVCLDFLAMVPVFHWSFGYTWEAALAFRAASAAINLLPRILLLWLTDRKLADFLLKHKGGTHGNI